MIKITHIITALNRGGAEMMLYRLTTGTDRTVFAPEVISLRDIGPVGQKIAAAGIPVQAMGMHPATLDVRRIVRLSKYLRQSRPDVIQTWLYHPNLLGSIAARLAGNSPIVWGIHSGVYDPQTSKRATITVMYVCAVLSRWLPTRIVNSSTAARSIHIRYGYSAKPMVVIPNGVDLDVFRPDSDARLALRHELHLTEDAILIGIVARFHPQKDHATFVQAAGKLHRMCPQVQFVLCGDGMVWENRTLVDWLEAAGVSHCCHLLGERDDIPYLNAALDIATLSSAFGETFGIVIAEAMACEVPCVVTDLAVAAQIVGDTGRVVPIKNPQAMAVAWQELIALGRDALQQLGQRARQRILEHYSLPATIAGYESLYKDLAGYIGP